MAVKIACRLFCHEPIGFKYLFFITSSNWFIPSYIGLLFLAPILNMFCNNVSKKTLWRCVLILLFIEMWFDWLPPNPKKMIGTQYGYSVLSFAILYLLARAIRLHGLPQWFKRNSPLVYIACSLVLGFIAYIGNSKGLNAQRYIFAYTNPFVIISSVAFLMIFGQMSFQSKVINYIAKSTLAILFGHSAIHTLYANQFTYLYKYFSGIQVVVYWTLAIIIVFSASIAIDQLRILLYYPIKQLINKRIKNNNIYDLTNSK